MGVRYKSFASSSVVRERMQAQRRVSTGVELLLRRALYAKGLRYRVNVRPVPAFRCRADVVFFRQRVAVEVRGCFWHDCPYHGMVPRSNSEWWLRKFAATKARDRRSIRTLKRLGWQMVVVWEHDDIEEATARIVSLVRGETPG